MAEFDTTTQGPLTQNADTNASSGQPAGKGARAKASVEDTRRKKQDALEGEDQHKIRSSESDTEKGAHETAEQEAEDGGSHSQQSLQSQQTTVQFSSGGGVAGALSSLMALFASSAGLARASTGSAFNISNQTNTLAGKLVAQGPGEQKENLINLEGKNLGTSIGATSDTASESSSNKLNFDVTITSLSHSNTLAQDTITNLVNTISFNTSTIANTNTAFNSIPILVAGPTFSYVPTYNFNTFFFSPQINFAFPNSPIAGSGATLLSPYTGQIGNYLSQAGLATASSYRYEVISPLTTSTVSNSGLTGITVTPGNTPLLVNVSAAPASITTHTTGLTITASGDLVVNVSNPLSVLVDIQTSSTPFPIRLDVGPGQLVTSANSPLTPNTMVGSTIVSNPSAAGISVSYNDTKETGSTVFRDTSGTNTIIGDDSGLTVSSHGSVTSTDYGFTLPSSGVYAFPSNTLYRHVATTLSTANQEPATYGNFADSSVRNTIDLPPAPASYTLQMGGNVLDVYGTKYGIADTLAVVLPTNASTLSLPTNTITLGDNTLAGFGTSYGDLQTLTLSAQPGNSPTSLGTTDLVLRSNVLNVDKAIGSILYPHLQTLDMENTASASPANVQMTFQDSIIQGNQGSDTFYGDIQNLSNNTAGSYTGFNASITATTANGQVVTTTNDGNTNSITWGNDIYNGGGQNPLTPSVIAHDSYNFTLLEDAATQNAVMQGNALLTNFEIPNDSLTLTLSPALFKALDGVDQLGHIKQISIADLNHSVVFNPFSFSTATISSSNPLHQIDPTFTQYLAQNDPNQTVAGTIIAFDNGVGGSITLANNPSTFNDTITSFADISNLTIDVGFSYIPVAALPANQITASTPTQTQPFIYGEGPNNNTAIPSYYNELDNFFANSLFATYSTTLATGANPGVVATSAPAQVTTQDSATLQSGSYTTLSLPNASPSDNVTIDPWGTITVSNSVPFFAPLTIVAMDQQGHTATTTQWFGFFDAPINQAIPSGVTGVGLFKSNIITGGAASTIIGDPLASTIQAAGGANITNPAKIYFSNLISDTAGNATVYGDFKNVSFTVQGVDNLLSPPASASEPTSFTSNSTTFNTNAFYVLSGTTYGVTQDFDISVTGGSNATIPFTHQVTTASLDASAHYDNNRVTFAPQTLYGSGILFGDMDQLKISITGGSDPTATFKGVKIANTSGTIDVSATVDNNTFTFSPPSASFPTTISIEGDSAGQTSTIYGNVNSLLITDQSPTFKVVSPTLSINTTATFSGNQFIFGDEILTGGLGSTNFYGHLYTFGDPFNSTTPYYNGLVDGVTVSINTNPTTQEQSLTITDSNNNSITWGNDTYTGGAGHNTYHFTLVEDQNGYAVMQGFDQITNFNPTKDTLVFNVESNLYARLGMSTSNSLSTLVQKLVSAPPTSTGSVQDITITDSSGNAFINFTGGVTTSDTNGQIELVGDGTSITSLQTLATRLPTSIQINLLGAPYTPPTIHTNVPFDPVFVDITQPGAFSAFVTSPLPLTYTTTSPLPTGMTLSSGGILTVNVTGPVYGYTHVQVFDGTSTTPLPSTLVMAINATDGTIDRDPSLVVQGNASDFQAFETSTPGNTIIGGGADIQYTPTSPQSTVTYGSKLIYDISYTTQGHTVYGDIQNLDITNDGTSGSGINGQTLNFDKNIIDTTGTIYGNVQNIALTASASGASQPSGNAIVFADAVLIGGTGPNDFYGHAANFGNSDDPNLYGTQGFYDGVTVTTTNSNGETIMTIHDGNTNSITWGDDTYIGGTGPNTYHFTIVGTNASTPQAVMQGNDIITNFNPAIDTIALSMAYPLYTTLSTSLVDLLGPNGIQMSSTGPNSITLTFAGGGSLELDNLPQAFSFGQIATAMSEIQTNIIANLSLADPITAVASPTSTTMVFGNTTDLNTFSGLFNTGHLLDMNLGNNSIILTANGSAFFTASGIINTTFNTVTATDPYTSMPVTSNTSSTNPVHILALNGPLIDQQGNETGASTSDLYGKNSYVFVGHGNATITGGVMDISLTTFSNFGQSFTYQPKLIYDVSGLNDTVYGDGNTIAITTSNFISPLTTGDITFSIGNNYVQATGNLYGNFNTLSMTDPLSSSAVPAHNAFTFGDDTLVGGAGSNSFFGHLQVFGNSENSALYSLKNFYDGVTVANSSINSEKFVQITDGNSNVITWGNDTYTGGTGSNAYTFTIVGTQSAHAPVMQGFDTITNFNSGVDKLNFSLAYPVYNQLAGGSPLTSAVFLSDLSITQTSNAAILTFPGGGSITLDGYGTTTYANGAAVTAALTNSITVSLADPITATANPITVTTNPIILGQTDPFSAYTTLDSGFNTGHNITLSYAGLTEDSAGNVTYNGNTGIIDTQISSVTASDPYTSVTTPLTAAVEVVALNAPVTDLFGVAESGSTAAGVFIGNGGGVTGGGADISDSASGGVTPSPTSVTYGDMLIYNNISPLAIPSTAAIIGDVQNVTLSAQGSSDVIGSTLNPPTDPSNTIEAAHNPLIDFGATWIFSNASSTTYGNAQNITISATGSTDIYGGSGVITDNQDIIYNTIQSGNNTITASHTIDGVADHITITATDGFYSAGSGSTEQVSISHNTFQAGSNTLTSNPGSPETTYGDYNTISLTINSPANSGGTLTEASDFSTAVSKSGSVAIGDSLIQNNTFTFGGNMLTGGDIDSSLFAGIDKLIMANNEQTIASTTQPTSSSISSNSFSFGNTTETATGGITNFYGDINDLSKTDFDTQTLTSSYHSGQMTVSDSASNSITFGNDTMNASTTGANIFNLDLLLGSSSGSNVVVNEGSTTINHFGTPGPSNTNILNLQLSKALYNDIVSYAQTNNITLDTANNGGFLITPSILDSYMSAHNSGSVTPSNGNTVIDPGGNVMGDSITLNGVTTDSSGATINSLASLGANVEITADGVTTMGASATGANTFNIPLFANSNGLTEGGTTIMNFGTPGFGSSNTNTNMLNLELSTPFYNEVVSYAQAHNIPISANMNGVYLITGGILDLYLTANQGGVTQSNGNTVITFPSNIGGDSITLYGVTTNSSSAQIYSLADMGTNLEITADGITTMDPAPNPANVFNVTISGADLASYTQNTHIVDISSLGHIVDFAGEVQLNMSNAAFKAAGLNDANTPAQNLQILENDVKTSTGGIAVTTQTTGTGANAVTNTVLTFEATVNGHLNTYGSVTLHDTHFNPLDPLANHLLVTHH